MKDLIVKAIRVQDYNGMSADWNEAKEIRVAENEIIIQDVLNETLYWIGEQRIVLKSTWEKNSKEHLINNLINPQ